MLIARVGGSAGDGAGEDIFGNMTLGEAVDVEVFDKDEDKVAVVDLVMQDDDVGTGPIT